MSSRSRQGGSVRGGQVDLEAEVDLVETDADVPGGDAGRPVRADHDPGQHVVLSGEAQPYPVGLLLERPYIGLFLHRRTRRPRRGAQRRVELVALDHGQQRLGPGAGDRAPAVEHEGGATHAVAGGDGEPFGQSVQRVADEAPATGLVAGMLAALEHDHPGAAAGGGVGSGEARGTAAHHSHIPHRSLVPHRARSLPART